MLIQHILTEQLTRVMFDNPEFVRRNVIAAKVEKVIQAMTSQSFDDNTYPILSQRGSADLNESTHVAPICALGLAQPYRMPEAEITSSAVTGGLSVC